MAASFHSGYFGASVLIRSMAKKSWTGNGCSHQRVPSLSNVAMRSGTGTKSLLPFVVTFATKSRMDCLVLPSFHDGSGSAVAEELDNCCAFPFESCPRDWCRPMTLQQAAARSPKRNIVTLKSPDDFRGRNGATEFKPTIAGMTSHMQHYSADFLTNSALRSFSRSAEPTVTGPTSITTF